MSQLFFDKLDKAFEDKKNHKELEEEVGRWYKDNDSDFDTDTVDDILYDDYADVFYNIKKTAEFKGDKLVVYRNMMVPNIEEFLYFLSNEMFIGDFKGLGIYWSWDKDAAESHWGYGKGVEIQLKALVNINDIDYDLTIVANVHPSYTEEREINIKPNSKVEILGVETQDDFIDLPAEVESPIEMRATSDDDLKDIIQEMRDSGLVPTGKGKHTLPSKVPSFDVVWDKSEDAYYLIAYLHGGESVWVIQENGKEEFIGNFKGTFKVDPQEQVLYGDADFHDYVPLEVITKVYELLDPDFSELTEEEQEGLDKFEMDNKKTLSKEVSLNNCLNELIKVDIDLASEFNSVLSELDFAERFIVDMHYLKELYGEANVEKGTDFIRVRINVYGDNRFDKQSDIIQKIAPEIRDKLDFDIMEATGRKLSEFDFLVETDNNIIMFTYTLKV